MSTLTAILPAVNFALTASQAVEVADDFRPTFDPSYYPTLEEERDARELFDDAADDEADAGSPDWDALAEDAANRDRYMLGCYAW